MDGLGCHGCGLHSVPTRAPNDVASGARAQRDQRVQADAGRRICEPAMVASILSYALVIILAPILVPLAFCIALSYSPEDTVPAEEDL